MHEWALAEAVVETIRKELENRNVLQVESVTISCGALQNVDEDIFRTGLREFLSDTLPVRLEDFVFEREPARFSCNRCRHEWELDSSSGLSEDDKEGIHFLPEAAHSLISCPACGSSDFSIITGRGVGIKSIEIVEA